MTDRGIDSVQPDAHRSRLAAIADKAATTLLPDVQGRGQRAG